MRSEELLELIRRQPFRAFRIHATDGQTYDVSHPDQIIVLRSRAVIGVGSDDGLPERVEHLGLVHVVRLEELAPESGSAA